MAMTVKEYLGQIRNMERKIRLQKLEIDRLRELSVSISIKSDGDKIQSSGNSDPISSSVLKILDEEAKLECLINEYLEKRDCIKNQIEQLDNDIHCDLLYGRYVVGLSFDDIAYQIGKRRRQTIYIHGRALQEFEAKFSEKIKKI